MMEWNHWLNGPGMSVGLKELLDIPRHPRTPGTHGVTWTGGHFRTSRTTDGNHDYSSRVIVDYQLGRLCACVSSG